MAAEFDYPDVIRVLVKHGAQINAIGNDRETPLHTAVSCGSPLAIRVLLELGADTEIIDSSGRSPAYLAAHLGLIDSLRPFVDAGLDFTHIYPMGWTIPDYLLIRLKFGFHRRDLGMINFILEHGGEKIMNARVSHGATPQGILQTDVNKKLNKNLDRLLYGAVR